MVEKICGTGEFWSCSLYPAEKIFTKDGRTSGQSLYRTVMAQIGNAHQGSTAHDVASPRPTAIAYQSVPLAEPTGPVVGRHGWSNAVSKWEWTDHCRPWVVELLTNFWMTPGSKRLNPFINGWPPPPLLDIHWLAAYIVPCIRPTTYRWCPCNVFDMRVSP